MVQDLREENALLRQNLEGINGRLTGVEAGYKKQSTEGDTRFDKLADEVRALSAEMKEGFEEKAKDVEVGVWQSSAANSNYRKWNVPLVKMPEGLLRMDDDGSKIVFLKPGLYKIHGAITTSNGSNPYVYLYLNGSEKHYFYNYGGGNYVSIPFMIVMEIKANDYLQTYLYSNPVNNKMYDTLIIQRLGG